jgi:subtilisin family serine protease
MKYFIRNICCILLLLITQQAMANKKIHVQFAQKEYTPILKADGNLIQVTFPSSDLLQEIFSAYKIKLFEKFFPTIYKEKHYLAASLDLVYVIDADNGMDVLYEQLKSLNKSIVNEVAYVEDPITLNTPNDFDLFTSTAGAPTGLAFKASNPLNLVNVREAWDITMGSPSQLIGIMDVGLAFLPSVNHVDVVNKIAINDAQHNQHNYHGVQMASIAAGETNNGIGITGVGYNSKLYLNDLGFSGILVAAQKGVKVINCSWGSCFIGGQQYMDNFFTIINDTYRATVIASAGNGFNGTPCSIIPNATIFPASAKYVISVTSVAAHFDQGILTAGKKANWKDRAEYIVGETFYNHTMNASVDLAAPGYNVATAYVYYNSNTNTYENRYVFNSGASCASPIVSGAVALMLAVNPALNPEDVEAILKCTARDLYEIPENVKFLNLLGSGRLDVGKAVQMAQTWVPGTAPLQQDPPKDIRWFEVLTNGYKTIEVEVTDACSPNSILGFYNKGFRLEVVAPNPNQAFKWLTFYGNNDEYTYNYIRYGNSVNLVRGVDYPMNITSPGKIKACVRVNECINSIYYQEDFINNCISDGLTYSCQADITISNFYDAPLTESSTWVKTNGQTTIDPNSSVKLDANPSDGFVEIAPTNDNEYLVAEPDNGEFIAQAYNGCGVGAPTKVKNSQFENKNSILETPILFTNKLKPNPTNGMVQITMVEPVSKIEVYNANGVLVLTKFINKTSKTQMIITLDLSNFSAGVYYVKGVGSRLNTKVVKL